ncbi:zinc-dependent alcohol dehydrogenase [Microbacterium atlanticum]|uniref:zinc-dependent alcohol dehydrogenase n=1 Tax=Microbacterium atlanticum TaxID=2782168 RepID=UPI0018898332|nr:zinc-binding dehydrogenase [Microbacterium atlanticum]
MRAILHHSLGGEVTIGEIEAPVPGAHDVIVRPKAVQIGTDSTRTMVVGSPRVKPEDWVFPHVSGRRAAGIVEAVGSEVTRFEVGDRVIIKSPITCNACEWCQRGISNMCPNNKLYGNDVGSRGALAELTSAPEWSMVRLHDDISFVEATLLPDVALMVHMYERAQVIPGFTTVIYGTGRVGLCAVLAAKAFGASRIVAVDTRQTSLDLARKLGATDTILAGAGDTVASLYEILPDGAEVVVELAGHASVIAQAFSSAARRGRIMVLSGLMGLDLSMPDWFGSVIEREVDIRGIYGLVNDDYLHAMRMVSAGLIDLQAQTIVEYEFDDFASAFAASGSPTDIDLHVVVS